MVIFGEIHHRSRLKRRCPGVKRKRGYWCFWAAINLLLTKNHEGLLYQNESVIISRPTKSFYRWVLRSAFLATILKAGGSNRKSILPSRLSPAAVGIFADFFSQPPSLSGSMIRAALLCLGIYLNMPKLKDQS